MTQAPGATRLRGGIATAMLSVAVMMTFLAAATTTYSLGRPVAITWGTQAGLFVSAPLLLTFPVMGWLIVRRDASNTIGWLMLWVGVIAPIDLSARAYSTVALLPGSTLPFGPEVGNFGGWAWLLWVSVIAVFLPPLFPSGRALSRRWRVMLFILAVGVLIAASAAAVAPGPLEVDPRVRNPFGVDHPIVEMLQSAFLVIPLGALLSVVAVVIRYRRAGAVQRVQLRWFVGSVVVVAAAFNIAGAASSVMDPTGTIRPLALGIIQDIANSGWGLMGIAIGLAVLRYRLYAIDVVINRALVYTFLTAILGSVYLLVVLVLQTVLRPFAGEGQAAVAGSTLVVAALFRPVRRRIQSLIDRQFYRARYDAQQLVASFSSRMRRHMDLGEIIAELEGTVATAFDPSAASVWLRPREGEAR